RCTERPVCSMMRRPVVPVANSRCSRKTGSYAMAKWTVSSFFLSWAIKAMFMRQTSVCMKRMPDPDAASAGTCPSIEEMLEPVHEAVQFHDFLDGQIDARHVAGPFVGIMPDFQGLSVAAENDFLLGENAGQTDAVDAESGIVAAAGAFDRLVFLRIALAELPPHAGAPFRRLDGGAARRIQLLVAVVLDDFHVGQVFGRLFGEFHHENGAD